MDRSGLLFADSVQASSRDLIVEVCWKHESLIICVRCICCPRPLTITAGVDAAIMSLYVQDIP